MQQNKKTYKKGTYLIDTSSQLAKKRYVGYMWENEAQKEPIFDAKGIETVRRDSCPAVAKVMEKSIRALFDTKDLSHVKAYLQRQWAKILAGRVSIQVCPLPLSSSHK